MQVMRQNEDAQAARLQRLESQLSGASHARMSRTISRTSRGNSRETLEPPGGGQVYPSFPPPPTDDAREADVSSTASALSTLSSLSLASRDERAVSAEKERQTEEKEKESSGDEDSKRRVRSGSSVSASSDHNWLILLKHDCLRLVNRICKVDPFHIPKYTHLDGCKN